MLTYNKTEQKMELWISNYDYDKIHRYLIATINIFILVRPIGHGYQMFLKRYPIPLFAFLMPLSRWLHHNKK